MSLKQNAVLAIAILMSYAAGVVTAQLPEKLEVTGNMKLFGAGNGIIFPDGTKLTSAGVGSSTDVTCPTPCVGAGEIAPSAVGTSEVADNTLTANDLATDSVGADEIAANAVGTSEVADNTLTANDLATDSVGALEIAANAVGTSEVSNNSLTSDDLGTNSVAADEIATDAVGASEVVDKSIRMTELNGTFVMGYQLDFFLSLNNGSCTGFSGQGAANVAANSFILIWDVRPVGSNTNPGWVIQGEDTPVSSAGQFDVRVCNHTGANAADIPALRFNFLAIAP